MEIGVKLSIRPDLEVALLVGETSLKAIGDLKLMLLDNGKISYSFILFKNIYL